jgi:hypothetical protein
MMPSAFGESAMGKEAVTATWPNPAWLEQATAAAAAQAGLHITGTVSPIHQTPWSSVLRVPTEHGELVFKASSAATRHEVPVVLALRRWAPDVGPDIVAADVDAGWVLMRPAGRRLREMLEVVPNLRHWRKILVRYAALQVASVEHGEEMLQAGVPDRRCAALCRLYQRLLHQEQGLLLVGGADGLRSEQHRQLVALESQLADICQALSAVPDALHHGDLHDGNIFCDHGRWRLLDWGDSCISHPFYSLRTVRVSVADRFGLGETSPQLHELEDAYLEPWERYAGRSHLKQILVRSEVLAPINGALTWARVIRGLAPATRQPFRVPVPALLAEALECAQSQGGC